MTCDPRVSERVNELAYICYCCSRTLRGLCGFRATKTCQKMRAVAATSHYSITSSARASSVGGTSRPSALAVLRLMTSSYLLGA